MENTPEGVADKAQQGSHRSYSTRVVGGQGSGNASEGWSEGVEIPDTMGLDDVGGQGIGNSAISEGSGRQEPVSNREGSDERGAAECQSVPCDIVTSTQTCLPGPTFRASHVYSGRITCQICFVCFMFEDEFKAHEGFKECVPKDFRCRTFQAICNPMAGSNACIQSRVPFSRLGRGRGEMGT